MHSTCSWSELMLKLRWHMQGKVQLLCKFLDWFATLTLKNCKINKMNSSCARYHDQIASHRPALFVFIERVAKNLLFLKMTIAKPQMRVASVTCEKISGNDKRKLFILPGELCIIYFVCCQKWQLKLLPCKIKCLWDALKEILVKDNC